MITIRLLLDSDIELINDFYFQTYGRKRTKEKFKWEYLNGPSGSSIYVIAFDTDNQIIAGTIAAIPFEFRNNKGIRVITAKVEDLLIHPRYRGKMLFQEMYALLLKEGIERGIDYFWAFTYATKPFIRVGFQVPFHSNLGILVTNVFKAIHYLKVANSKNSQVDKLKKIAFIILAWFNGLKCKSSNNNLADFEFIDSDQKDLNSLLVDSTIEETFFISQDADFIKWRILDNPYIQTFEHRSLSDMHGHLQANLIYSHSKEGVCHIVQNIFGNHLDFRTKLAFLKINLNTIRRQSFIVRYWGFSHNAEGQNDMKILKSAGFTFSNRGIPFVWQKIGGDLSIDPTQLILSRMASQGTV